MAHGAGAPQVRRAARERLDSLVLPAIKVLRSAVKKAAKAPGDKDKQVLALKAAIAILDRTGFGTRSTVEIEDNSGQPKINIEGLSDEAKRDILATLARYGVIGNGANGGSGAGQLAGVSATTDGEVIDVTPRPPRESSYSSPLTDLMLAGKSDEEPITLQSMEIAELPR